MSTHRAGSQEWDDDTLTDLKAARDEPVTEVIAYPLTQSAWDARQVHQLRQVEQVLAYWAANSNRPDDVLINRGAVILRAEPGADDAERLLGVRTDVEGTAAYLAEPLPDGAQRKALPAAKPGWMEQSWVERTAECPHGCGRYVRLDRHLRRKHPHTEAGKGDSDEFLA